jgi:hypothetical protein
MRLLAGDEERVTRRVIVLALVTLAMAITSASCSYSLQPGPGASRHDGKTDRSTTTTTRPVRTAALYISTGIEPGSIFAWPHYPALIDVTSSASFGSLQWTAVDPDEVTGTGNYSYDTCNPNCATGAEASDPVTITASDPKRCTVNVFDPGSASPTPLVARVFSEEEIGFAGTAPPSKPTLGPICS